LKTIASLKGQQADAPFRCLRCLGNTENIFRSDALVICFRMGISSFPTVPRKLANSTQVVILHTAGRWAIATRLDANWHSWPEDRHFLTYDGTTEALKQHVIDILASREITITARTPTTWRGEPGRLWRIKAGPGVTQLMLSDESPHFVGWGS